MLVDAATIPPGARLGDRAVCIVGSGPAGLTLALELARAGVGVIVLESGGLREDRADRALLKGSSVGYPHLRPDIPRGRAFGGTSVRWDTGEGWRVRPLDPIDFEPRPELGLPGWPFDRPHLDPFYARAQDVCGMGPYTYDPEDWRTPGAEPWDLPSDIEQVLFQIDPRRFTRYRPEVASSSRIDVLTRATVLRLQLDASGRRVASAEVRTRAGHTFEVTAAQFVVAAGALDNPRLLLLSAGEGLHARGLGNQHDNVGRYYHERLAARSGEFVLDRPELADRTAFYDFHGHGERRLHGAVRLRDAVLRREGLLNGIFYILRRSVALPPPGTRSTATLLRAFQRAPWVGDTRTHLVKAARDARALARLTADLVLPTSLQADHGLVLRLQCQQSPNRDSRVSLDPRRRDAHGQPRVRVDWRIHERDRRSIRRSQELLDENFRKAGIGHLRDLLGDEDPPALFEGLHHNLGTTRMHVDPRQGVVDPDCRVHDVDNLYLAGSSVFPTAGASNPTLTLVALALRLADHLAERLRSRDGSGTPAGPVTRRAAR